MLRLSEIVIILYKKYQGKNNILFPQSLDFPSNGKILHYIIVAQVEHMGLMRGGHYMVNCLRVKNDTFTESRGLRIKIKIEETKKTLSMLNPSSEQYSQYINRLKDLKKMLSDNDDNNKLCIFSFNDSYVMYHPSLQFIPTENTYMVIYHIK